MLPPKVCEHCHQSFTPHRSVQRYCGVSCAVSENYHPLWSQEKRQQFSRQQTDRCTRKRGCTREEAREASLRRKDKALDQRVAVLMQRLGMKV